MLSRKPGDMSEATSAFLGDRQSEVDGQATHLARAERARALFGLKDNNAFREVIAALSELTSAHPDERAYCYYCEHDRRAAVEHVFPSRHYPERAFQYQNYALACFNCNTIKKGDRFAVFDAASKEVVEFDWKSLGENPPPVGQPVLIDLRLEDPLEFIRLDFATGFFAPRPGLDKEKQKRAGYTIRLLGLNDDGLPRRRLEYVDAFRRRFDLLLEAERAGNDDAVRRIITSLREAPHQTVMTEMVLLAVGQAKSTELMQEGHSLVPNGIR